MKNIIIEVRCPFCGEVSEVMVEDESFALWQNGELIQRAMPYLSAQEREILISGMCPECQREVFGSGETEWEDDEPSDCDLESGFDPYEGCYTFDC